MGYYINHNHNGVQLPNCNKADYLLLDGGIEIPEPHEFIENLVCVVENGPFDAALYCYNENEMNIAKDHSDRRPKRWIVYSKAAKLSGYEQ